MLDGDLRAIQRLRGLRVVSRPVLTKGMGRNGHASLPVYLLNGAHRGLNPQLEHVRVIGFGTPGTGPQPD